MTKVVVDLNFSKERANYLKNRYKEVDFIVTQSKEELHKHIKEAEIFVTFNCSEATISNAANLKWIQGGSAGVDFMPLEVIRDRGMVLTNGKGIHRTHMSEYAIAAMINLARNFHVMFRNQLDKKWDRSPEQGEIQGATVGIIGLGSIGKEIAKKASFMGMKVLGVKRTVEEVDYVEEVFTTKDMEEVFKKSDYIINLLPYTHKTHKMINRHYLNLMKSTACFINIGRGKTMDEEALIDLLKDKRIKAMVSDVYYEEPLSRDSALWELDNVILTPHICGESTKYLDRFIDIFEHNMDVYLSGEGNMINVVDLNEGY